MQSTLTGTVVQETLSINKMASVKGIPAVIIGFLILIAPSHIHTWRVGGDTSTTTTKQMVDKIMDVMDEHCSANITMMVEENTTVLARRKREVTPNSRDRVEFLLHQALAQCMSHLGELSSTAAESPLENPCSSPNTVNLTEEWRLDKRGAGFRPINNSYNCDAPLLDNIQWFRLTGSAGRRIRNTCSPGYSCGSHGGFWTNATMPYVVGEIVQLPLYGSWAGDCDWYTWPVDYPLTVKRCGPGHDYVYKIDGTAGCFHGVCGMF